MNAASIVNKLLEDNEKLEISSLVGKPVAEAEKLIGDHYHDNLLYRGAEFFDSVYMGKIIPCAEKALSVGSTQRSARIGRIEHDGQESYLGYLPDEDVFISGWDMFEGDDDDVGNGICYVKIDQQGRAMPIDGKVSNHGMMYGRDGGLRRLKSMHKNLVDIRLD